MNTITKTLIGKNTFITNHNQISVTKDKPYQVTIYSTLGHKPYIEFIDDNNITFRGTYPNKMFN